MVWMCWRLVYKTTEGPWRANWCCDFDLLAAWVKDVNHRWTVPHTIESCWDVGLPCIADGNPA